MKVGWIIILALGLLGTATFFPVIKTTEGATTITRTVFTTKAWFKMAPAGEKHASPLADWCDAHGVSVTEETVFYSSITRNLWGHVWTRGDGPAPASYTFTPAMQTAWLAKASEAEVRRFIDAMQATDEAGRAHLIDKANDQVLGVN